MNNLNYSANGRSLTEASEGLRLTSYQDSVGVWTIGFGHTGPDVHPDMICTQEQADAWLEQDVQGAVHVVNSVVTVVLNQNQFDALVDFVFNLGSGNFQSSTLLKLLNSGDYEGASGQFPLWNHAGGVVLSGLTVRRLAEQKLFDTPITVRSSQPQISQEQTTPQQSSQMPTLVQQLQTWVQALRDKFSSK